MASADLISKKTRTEFREFLVGSKLREISDQFEAVGLQPVTSFVPPVGGQRRSLVEQFYKGVDFGDPTDAQKVLQVYENILTHALVLLRNPDTCPGDAAQFRRSIDGLVAWLKKDGYDFIDGRLASTGRSATLKHLKAKATAFSAEYLSSQIERLETAVTTDPDLAIGQAKELVETCCKTILAERGITDFEKLDLQPLVRRTAELLKLTPDAVPDAAKGARTIKAVLGNLAIIAQGLAELRNLYGTGHGKHGRSKGLSPRHARLSVGAASALVTFLFETHAEQTPPSVTT